jgi:4-oxalocrotonate tautomerase
VRAIGTPAGSVDILFYDIAKQDWATGGTLWSEMPPKPAG